MSSVPEATSKDGSSRAGVRSRRVVAGVVIGVLTALLGFAIAAQVRSNSSADSLDSARADDLVHILDDQNQRADTLREQIARLQTTLQQLTASGSRDTVAREQAEQELASLQLLLGTVPARGPGIEGTIADPTRSLRAEDLLEVVEELRGSGAEAIQFGPVRVATATNFTDGATGIKVDGVVLTPPYIVLAIGDPKTMDTALNIPGGVAATVRAAGGTAQVVQRDSLDITAVATPASPRYAVPSR